MLGLNDLSLIPLQSFQNIQIIKGGSTALYGNGAMTGVIDVSNQHNLSKSIVATINTNYGSFNKQSLGANLEFNIANTSIRTSYQNTTSDNNFTYNNLAGDTKVQSHARLKSESATLSAFHFINNNSFVKFNYWHQNTFRQIPPTTVQTRSQSDLHDIIHRYSTIYSFIHENFSANAKLAYLNEQNNFRDSTNLIFTNNRFQSYIHKVDFKYSFANQHNINWGYSLNRTRAQTAFYEQNQTINNTGFYAGYDFRKGSNNINLTIRQELHSEVTLPLAPSLSYIYNIDNYKNITFKISKEFRAPTANELYWRPGGNSNLKPEVGWGQEINFRLKSKRKDQFTLSLFHRKINNWILWSLNDLQFFESTNIASVRSYGIDLNQSTHFKTKKIKHQLLTSYVYVIAKNLKSISTPNIRAGDQLFYKPKHKISVDLNSTYKSWKTNINAQYVSSTIGTLDNLEGYELFNISLEKAIKLNTHKIDFSISINNLLNKQYRVIERRPMPGRHFDLGLKLNLN